MDKLPELHSGRLSVIVSPSQAAQLVLEMIARLALRAPVRVLDGGNRFNAYTVARLLHQRTSQVETVLKRIRVARSFTCYQMAVLLENTPHDLRPTLVLNLLVNFYDENISLDERQRLLHDSINELRRLSRYAPVMVSARLPKPEQPERWEFIEVLESAADQVWRFERQEAAPPLQLF